MINPALLNLDGSFDLPAFLLSEVYGPIQVDGRHIDWSMEHSVSLANDLTAEKQQELLNALGDNGNYDVFPIAVLEFEEE